MKQGNQWQVAVSTMAPGGWAAGSGRNAASTSTGARYPSAMGAPTVRAESGQGNRARSHACPGPNRKAPTPPWDPVSPAPWWPGVVAHEGGVLC